MLFGVNSLEEVQEITDHPEKIINLMVDGLVRQYPEFYLKEYPVLEHQYNPDGTKKSYYELKTIADEKTELMEFYNQMINEDPLLKIQKIEYEMTQEYCTSKNKNRRNQIINEGLSQIRQIIENENIDIDSILVYFDRRMKELKNENVSQMIFLLTKQIALQKEIIKQAYIKTNSYKQELVYCQDLLIQKCKLKIDNKDRKTIKNDLRSLRLQLNYAYNDGFLSEKWMKGLTKEELFELIEAVEKYDKFLNIKGYVLFDDETLAGEKNNNFLEGYDNLYQTNYYKQVISKDRKLKVEVYNDFELLNQIYIDILKSIRRTGDDPNNSLIQFSNDKSIIYNHIVENPNLLDLLYKIQEMEEDNECLTRLEAVIKQCELYVRDSKKAM